MTFFHSSVLFQSFTFHNITAIKSYLLGGFNLQFVCISGNEAAFCVDEIYHSTKTH